MEQILDIFTRDRKDEELIATEGREYKVAIKRIVQNRLIILEEVIAASRVGTLCQENIALVI